MRIIAAPDSFKGSLSAVEVAAAIEAGVLAAAPDAVVVRLPVADGGEGTLDALVNATGGRKISRRVTGPLGDPVEAALGVLGDGETAVVEMAAASGLTLVPSHLRNPLLTTTYGTGELVRAALGAGVTKIVVGVGGSATNDGGAGAMQALGVRLLDAEGCDLPPGGASLLNLSSIDLSNVVFPRRGVEVKVACDVTNTLLGPEGASVVYGPQKGATPEMVRLLDKALERYAQVIHRLLSKDIANLRGAGAAGGLAAGLAAFLDAELVPGAGLVLETVRFDDALCGADLVITGEGRIDRQTLYGKTISTVVEHARAQNVPVIALAGSIGEGSEGLYDVGVAEMCEIAGPGITEEESMRRGAELVADAACGAIRRWKAAKGL